MVLIEQILPVSFRRPIPIPDRRLWTMSVYRHFLGFYKTGFPMVTVTDTDSPDYDFNRSITLTI